MPVEPELARRLRQQEIIADFALFGLRVGAHADEWRVGAQVDGQQDRLCDEACRCAARGLDVLSARILRYQPETDDFLLANAVGWDPDLIGTTRLGNGQRSPAGHAFRTGQPVLCGDGRSSALNQALFRLPRLLREHGMRSAIVVPVCDPGCVTPFGVLEVDSQAEDAFVAHDVTFLRALGNILCVAIEAHARAGRLHCRETFIAAVLDTSPDCVEVVDGTGTIVRINRNAAMLPASRLGEPWARQWAQADRPCAEQALAQAAEGGTGRFCACRPAADGVAQWWDVLVAAMPTGEFVAVSRDATAQAASARAKDDALREKDLLLLEVHHRVKNSLQLVQNLLELQGRAAGDGDTAIQLNESATRVGTIAASHDRLYRAGSGLDVEIAPYLEGLIADLQSALVGAAAGRRIALQADAACWPAAEVPTLGLVLTELITNALKYGAGDIAVRFRQPPFDHATLIVEDGGPGPKPDFEPGRSSGLGMRLVTGLLRGQGAGLSIDRDCGHARFIARLPYRRQH